MSRLQLTLPGITEEPAAGTVVAPPTSAIHIDLDDQKANRGRAINLKVLQGMVNRFHKQVPTLRPNEAAAYIVDRQLLHILLSSAKCKFLLLSKCIRCEDGKESIAVTALDRHGVPLGVTIDRETRNAHLTSKDSDISSGEWIGAVTIEEEIQKGVLPAHGIDRDINFEGYMQLVRDNNADLFDEMI